MIIVILFIIGVITYLIIDYSGPQNIPVKLIDKGSNNWSTTSELIPQEYDAQGNLWASRGMVLYCLKCGDTKFRKVAHVPVGISFYWLYNLSLFRKVVNKPECMVVSISGDGHLCAMSAGNMWYKHPSKRRFVKSLALRHFGLGVGRGIFSNGMTAVGESTIYFGEYFRNTVRGDVRVYRSTDHGRSWEVAYQFEAGDIRHIHAIQQDPYTSKLWICCGDKDNESVIAYSEDHFQTLHQVGRGSQLWRTCHLVFTQQAVYWGADTGSIEHSGVYCWNKTNQSLKKICAVKGAILYGTAFAKDQLVFTTDREGFENEDDTYVRLVVIGPDKQITEIKIGTWKHAQKDYRYSFAMLRIPRNSRAGQLVFSVINQNEFSMGKLVMLSSKNLDDLIALSKEKKYESQNLPV